jgi:hypothetical protein
MTSMATAEFDAAKIRRDMVAGERSRRVRLLALADAEALSTRIEKEIEESDARTEEALKKLREAGVL